ncbi:hypothetical protein [Sorangium sp. So ce362]|uniref:hypothetical protein n=1 Tax=Sorangium sp. So ce362 TaxID=3133303 RepID=UPI003F616B65
MLNLWSMWGNAGVTWRWNGGNPIVLVENANYINGNDGLTLGHFAFLKESAVTDADTYHHELAHVDQHDILGEAYLPLHILAQAYSFARTGHYAKANPLEHGPP